MSLIVLIPVSIGMGLIGLAAFIWALRHDQFDDPQGNAERVLIPDAPLRMKDDDDGTAASQRDSGDRRKTSRT